MVLIKLQFSSIWLSFLICLFHFVHIKANFKNCANDDTTEAVLKNTKYPHDIITNLPNNTFKDFELINYKTFIYENAQKQTLQNGHVIHVNNARRLLTALEPLPGGCARQSAASVSKSVSTSHCEVALNAGLFDTHTHACKGNLIINGHLLNDARGAVNAHFGILRNGSLFFGYPSAAQVRNGIGQSAERSERADKGGRFQLLIGGVIWVIRNGANHVAESVRQECATTQSTGSLQRFATIQSARTILSVDAANRLALWQFDGKTGRSGVSLYEAARLLFRHEPGVRHAINFDGGGSSTLMVNGTLVNTPSDFCSISKQQERQKALNFFTCQRAVSSVFCVRRFCPANCSGQGRCSSQGFCECKPGFQGAACQFQLTAASTRQPAKSSIDYRLAFKLSLATFLGFVCVLLIISIVRSCLPAPNMNSVGGRNGSIVHSSVVYQKLDPEMSHLSVPLRQIS